MGGYILITKPKIRRPLIDCSFEDSLEWARIGPKQNLNIPFNLAAERFRVLDFAQGLSAGSYLGPGVAGFPLEAEDCAQEYLPACRSRGIRTSCQCG
jgi:hypothetical protein